MPRHARRRRFHRRSFGRRPQLRLPKSGGHALNRNGQYGAASLHLQRTFFAGQWISGSTPSLFTSASFDPSGTLGNTTFGSIPNAYSFPGWAAVKAVFDKYRLNWVKFTFSLRPITSASHDPPSNPLGCTIRIRYVYDPLLANSASAYSAIPEVSEFRFTPEAPVWSYKVYPRCLEPSVDGSGVITGYSVVKPGFVDIDAPKSMFGAYMWILSVPVDYQVDIDVTYDIDFREISV